MDLFGVCYSFRLKFFHSFATNNVILCVRNIPSCFPTSYCESYNQFTFVVRPSSKRSSKSARSNRPGQGNGGLPKRSWDHNDMKLYKNSEQIGGLVETEEKMYSEVKSLLTERLDVLSRMRHELKEGNPHLRR